MEEYTQNQRMRAVSSLGRSAVETGIFLNVYGVPFLL